MSEMRRRRWVAQPRDDCSAVSRRMTADSYLERQLLACTMSALAPASTLSPIRLGYATSSSGLDREGSASPFLSRSRYGS